MSSDIRVSYPLYNIALEIKCYSVIHIYIFFSAKASHWEGHC